MAFVHTALGRFGGAEKLCILHAIELKKMGIDVALFYGGLLPSYWLSRLESHKINIQTLPLLFKNMKPNLHKSYKTIQRLKAFDIVLIHHHVDPSLLWFISKTLDHKAVWYSGEPLRAIWEDYVSGQSYDINKETVLSTCETLYGASFRVLLELFYKPIVYMARTLDLNSIHSFKMVIANSYFTKRVITRLYGAKNVHVVYPGIEYNFFHEKEQIEPGKSKLILSVGAIIPIKNHLRLIEALKIVQKNHPDIRAVIVGDGPLKRNLLSASSGLKNFHILTKVTDDELMKLYSCSRFLVHVAIAEPFGLTPLEAALHGRPSIVSCIGGTSESIIHNKTGLLVDPYNVHEIAEAMEILLQDDELVNEMGLAARRRVLSNFTIEQSAKLLLDTLTLEKREKIDKSNMI
ncbi:MAG: glycosyltransferase family 4 protein [Candidatus Jordarchaeales archaeon]